MFLSGTVMMLDRRDYAAAQGLTSALIAEQLIIGVVTVNFHVRSIYSKLGVTSRSAATRFAIEHHLV